MGGSSRNDVLFLVPTAQTLMSPGQPLVVCTMHMSCVYVGMRERLCVYPRVHSDELLSSVALIPQRETPISGEHYVSICTYVYIYIYIYIWHIYIYIYIYIYMSVCVYIYMQTCMFVCVFWLASREIYIHFSYFIYIYIYIHICTYINICICTRKTRSAAAS